MTRVPDLISKAGALGIETQRGRWHSTQEWGKHYFLRYPLMVAWYCWVILHLRIDIVNPQSRDDSIFATRAAQILGKRVIWTDHAHLKYILNLKIHPFPWLRRWTINAARYAKAIVCVSQSELDEIARLSPPEFTKKLTLIHNGVFAPSHTEPVNKSSRYVIATNARLVPDKGIAELITGFAASKHIDQSQLWLIGGDSGNLNKFRALARQTGVAEKVRFVGYVAEPNNYIASADVFVHASYHEAFSLAIIEAAMLGKAIVATRVGGTPEIIDDDCGILVPPRNASALTRAIDDLLDNPVKRRRLETAAKQKALSQFDFTKIVKERILPLYYE